jgi:hypothetical protein
MTKPTKQDLEKPPIHVLVKFCSYVVSDPVKYTKERADKASKLLGEWLSLQSLPESSLKERQDRRRKLQLLYERLTTFTRET